MADRQTPQAKASDRTAMLIEQEARNLLNEVLPKSLKRPKNEYGGVIYQKAATGAIGHTGPFHGEGGENTVDVGANKPNMGCPDGTVPVGWYHTHPFDKVGELTFAARAFEDGDSFISDFNQIPGYLGVYDGTFWRYDPPKGTKPGEPLLLDGTPLKPPGKGTLVPLNGRLKTT